MNRNSLLVLVAEPDRDAAEGLAFCLEFWGHHPVLAHDLPSVLNAARRQEPDLILLDLGMPGTSGYRLAQQLRQELPDVRLVALSDYDDELDRARSLAAGFETQLHKPVQPHALKDLLHSPPRALVAGSAGAR